MNWLYRWLNRSAPIATPVPAPHPSYSEEFRRAAITPYVVHTTDHGRVFKNYKHDPTMPQINGSNHSIFKDIPFAPIPLKGSI